MATSFKKLVVLDGFNNYYNRKIKILATASEYETAVGTGNWYAYAGINFNPNDEVVTEQILNTVKNPDYVLVLNGDTEAIESRWFVLKTTRTRNGQYLLNLRRDLIADYEESLSTAPIYVEKGMLANNDPFVLNDEGMSLNQIKTSETLLKDNTGTAWIVGYYAKNASGSVSAQAGKIENIVSLSTIASNMGITATQLNGLLNTNSYYQRQVEFRFEFRQSLSPYKMNAYKIFMNGSLTEYSKQQVLVIIGNSHPLFINPVFKPQVMDEIASKIMLDASDVKTELGTAFNRVYLTDSQLAILRNYNGQYVLSGGNYYQISIEEHGEVETSTGWQAYTTYPNIATAITSGASEVGLTASAGGYLNIIGTAVEVRINLQYVSDTTVIPQLDVDLSAGRTPMEEQEFDMFVMPYSDIAIAGRDSNDAIIRFTAVGEYSRRIASAIALSETDKLYDLQLLPYCPFVNYWNAGMAELYLANLELGKDYDYITYTDSQTPPQTHNVGVILWCSSNKFSTKINQSLLTVTNRKTDVICDMHRIVSPNYQGTFEFNVAKNGGQVAYFLAECTYKPYTPFIKVAPNFRYLYGANYGDHRGLVCGGDFSLPRITSAWQTYQLNNKNYQNIFNRDIQNLDFRQSQEMRRALIGGGLGVVGDTIKGSASGGQIGATGGAIVGGAVGGVTSAVGMAIDIDMMVKRQREEKALAIDKYNYQLGNIKALPYTLTKIGAFDICSKIFPFLEYYTCTDTEREAFINKIKYESMTVMRIGYVGDFIGVDDEVDAEFKTADKLHYLKGTLIRNESIIADNNILSAIADELQKGVYI